MTLLLKLLDLLLVELLLNWLLRVIYTVLSLITVDFLDSLLNSCNVNHRLLFRCDGGCGTGVSLLLWDHLLRFLKLLLANLPRYYSTLVFFFLMHLRYVSLIRDACHVLLQYSLVQGDLPKCRRVRLSLSLMSFGVFHWIIQN